MDEALAAASKLLASRERTRRGLIVELERRGFSAEVSESAVARLAEAGAVDDERAATSRARVLADRGAGDALIRADLESRGVEPGVIQAAIEEVEPERERAGALVARRGAGPATARYLARKGFGDDAIQVALPNDVAE